MSDGNIELVQVISVFALHGFFHGMVRKFYQIGPISIGLT